MKKDFRRPTGGIDALGRKLPLGLSPHTDDHERLVGLFYFLWNGEHGDPDQLSTENISDILRRDPLAGYKPGDTIWGTGPTLYYWGEPLFGYYRSRDPWVIQKHVEMFMEADIDFLLMDTTNAFHYNEVMMQLLEALAQAKQNGWKVPEIAYFTNSHPGETVQRIYRDVYEKNIHPELWFRIDGKPLLITHEEECPEYIRSFFTIRESQWPNEPDRLNGFPWISFIRPQKVYADKNGRHTVISVSPAQHPQILMGDSALYGEQGNWGRSYHDGAHHITKDSVQYGYNFQEQWDWAIKADPNMVFVTGWNEWTMNRLEGPADRPVRFVDNADEEYSRDIEPMRGGHGDNYYMQLIGNVRRYKGGKAEPLSIPFTNKDPFNDWSVWNDSALFRPFVPTVICRDYPGFHGNSFYDDSIRNIFTELRILQTCSQIFFYAETRAPVSEEQSGTWMQLYLKDEQTADLYRVEHSTEAHDTAELFRKDQSGWSFLTSVRCSLQNNKLVTEIPKTCLSGNCFGFKWIDSRFPVESADDFYLHGHCSPIGRLMYLATTDATEN